eukprot:9478411-Alexandrium_andersonii.AAC.1
MLESTRGCWRARADAALARRRVVRQRRACEPELTERRRNWQVAKTALRVALRRPGPREPREACDCTRRAQKLRLPP